MAEAYRSQIPAPACAHTVSEVWAMFVQERSIALCPTSLTSDYRQVTKWLARCPVQDLAQGRQVLIWLLSQKPTLAARRVCLPLCSKPVLVFGERGLEKDNVAAVSWLPGARQSAPGLQALCAASACLL